MVKIRLRRMGARQKPFYRIVVADSRSPRDGRFIEAIGTYDPNTDPPAVKVNAERAQYWLSNGAQPTDIARALLKVAGFFGGVVEKPEKKAEPKKKAAKSKEAEAAAQEPPAAEEVPTGESSAPASDAETAGEVEGEKAE
ncbi:MAG: 30S ribosomal protein S16 [Armatimonadetes bacterium]|nr:30S ribosomal protein S16 [Armatimonadota bacterium]